MHTGKCSQYRRITHTLAEDTLAYDSEKSHFNSKNLQNFNNEFLLQTKYISFPSYKILYSLFITKHNTLVFRTSHSYISLHH